MKIVQNKKMSFGKLSHQVQDKELLYQFLAVEKMDKDRFSIKRILQAMIVISKVQNLQVSTL